MIPNLWPRTTLHTAKHLACNLIQQKYLLYSLQELKIYSQEYINNSAVGFLLVRHQKQTETAPHPQRQVANAKTFNLLQQPSYMRCQY